MRRFPVKIAALAWTSAVVLLSSGSGAQVPTPAPSPTSMQVGGLAPPPPMFPAAPTQPTSPRAAGQPVAQPSPAQPLGQPTAGQPAFGQPTAGQPAFGQPTAGQPALGQPTAGQPTPGQSAQPANALPAGQPAAPGSLQVGGLAPPGLGTGPSTVPVVSSPTSERLSRSDADDSGRGLDFVFVGVEGGLAYTSIDALHASGSLFAPSYSKSGAGVMGGAKAGLRLLYLTAGPHFRIAKVSDFMEWTLNLDFEWRVPLGKLEPYVLVGGGYARLENLSDPDAAKANAAIDGFDIRVGGGVDYYLSGLISIGGLATLEMTRLQRRAAPPAIASTVDSAWRTSASGVGLAFGLMVGPTLHF